MREIVRHSDPLTPRPGRRRGAGSLMLAGLLTLLSVLPLYGDAVTEAEKRLLDDIRYLASDELEGRGVETEGINTAAEYVREQFRKAGLDVTAINGGAFQAFEMNTGAELGSPNALVLHGPDDQTIELKYDDDFRTCAFGGSGKFSADVVFAGYGIQDKDTKFDEFAGVDVKDRVVIIVRRNPQQNNPHGPFAGPHGGVSSHAALRTKISNAYGAGAKAVLFVNDDYSGAESQRKADERLEKARESLIAAAIAFETADSKDEEKSAEARKKLSDAVKRVQQTEKAAKEVDRDPLMKFGYGGTANETTIPVLHITRAAADQMVKAALGHSLADLEEQIDEDLEPRSAALKSWKVSGETNLKQITAEVKNVIGVLEGEGPLADETVVIGAHYDHVGLGGKGSLAPGSKEVHNGADDNASGTVSLIELARRLASRKEKPARRIVFIAFTAEELGLIGSARYCKEPVFPLDKTVAMFNMDMVGRLDENKLTVFGTGTAPRWDELLKTSAEKHGFKLSTKESGFGPSDHSSFYAKKIPVLHFFTGTHKDYHRPSDDWDKINVPGMRRVVDMIEELAWDTVQKPERPKYVAVKGRAAVRTSGNRPYFGSIPAYASEEPGCFLQGVTPDGPADKAGLKGGDQIVKFGDQKIGSVADFAVALSKYSAGDEVTIVVKRDGKELKLTAILGKSK